MSRLEYMSRPLVAFDPHNKLHRRYYAEFVESGGWGHCPVRFICPQDHGLNLPDMIRQSLVDYYIVKEFGGSTLVQHRAEIMNLSADQLYKTAGKLRKQARALETPRH